MLDDDICDTLCDDDDDRESAACETGVDGASEINKSTQFVQPRVGRTAGPRALVRECATEQRTKRDGRARMIHLAQSIIGFCQ